MTFDPPALDLPPTDPLEMAPAQAVSSRSVGYVCVVWTRGIAGQSGLINPVDAKAEKKQRAIACRMTDHAFDNAAALDLATG